MENKFLLLFKVPATRKKILITLGLLAIYRVGFQIPIPGMSPEFIDQLSSRTRGQLFGLMNAFSGSQIGSTVIFSLGIMPYISASIIFSMLSKVSPKIEAVAKEGASGQKKINQWTRLATVPIALIQAILVYSGVFMKNPEMIARGIDTGFVFFLMVVLALVGGAMFVMWVGELITEYGIGNGASLIIMARIIAALPSNVNQLLSSADFYHTLLYLIAIWLITVVVIVYITKGARRIPIQYARLTRGRSVYGGQRHFLPMKVNMAGVMPIIFASILFVIPSVLASVLGWAWLQSVFNSPTGFVYTITYVGLIIGFTFFWNRLMFNEDEIANNLRENGSFVPGIRPGKRTAEFLGGVRDRITFTGSVFLAVIAVLPNFVTANTTLPPAMAYFLGGTSVLIVVGVAIDLVERLNAQLVMRNYEGFMKSSNTGPGAGWARRS